jgi:hypothetical protein
MKYNLLYPEGSSLQHTITFKGIKLSVTLAYIMSYIYVHEYSFLILRLEQRLRHLRKGRWIEYFVEDRGSIRSEEIT